MKLVLMSFSFTAVSIEMVLVANTVRQDREKAIAQRWSFIMFFNEYVESLPVLYITGFLQNPPTENSVDMLNRIWPFIFRLNPNFVNFNEHTTLHIGYSSLFIFRACRFCSNGQKKGP